MCYLKGSSFFSLLADAHHNVLPATCYLQDSQLVKHLRVNLLRNEFVLVVSRPQDVVLAHAPGIKAVLLIRECI